MTPDEIPSELKRNRNILLAAIDYLIERNAGRVKWDDFDPNDQYCRKLKEQTEKYYQNNNLRSLEKLFQKTIEEQWLLSDLNFGSYIKEKTGYETDIFIKLQERISGIIRRGSANNKREYWDVSAMIYNLEQTGADPEKLKTLNSLSLAFNERRSRRKPGPSKKSDHFSNELSDTFSPDHKHRLIISESGSNKENAVTQVFLNSEKGGASIYIVNGINLGIKVHWKDNATIIINTNKDYKVVSVKCQQLQLFNNRFRIELIEAN